MHADEIRRRAVANCAYALVGMPVVGIGVALATAYQAPATNPLQWINLLYFGLPLLALIVRRLVDRRDHPARLIVVSGPEPAFVVPARYGYGLWYGYTLGWVFAGWVAAIVANLLRGPENWVSENPILAAFDCGLALLWLWLVGHGLTGLWRGSPQVRLLADRIEVHDGLGGGMVVPWDAIPADTTPWTHWPFGLSGISIQRYPVAHPELLRYLGHLPGWLRRRQARRGIALVSTTYAVHPDYLAAAIVTYLRSPELRREIGTEAGARRLAEGWAAQIARRSRPAQPPAPAGDALGTTG